MEHQGHCWIIQFRAQKVVQRKNVFAEPWSSSAMLLKQKSHFPKQRSTGMKHKNVRTILMHGTGEAITVRSAFSPGNHSQMKANYRRYKQVWFHWTRFLRVVKKKGKVKQKKMATTLHDLLRQPCTFIKSYFIQLNKYPWVFWRASVK